MAQKNYPDLTYPEVYKVQTIGINLKSDKDYIENSPYSQPIKDSLNSIFFRNPETSPALRESLTSADIENVKICATAC